MKTRDEQIREAAQEYRKGCIIEKTIYMHAGFIDGADWADSHPAPLTIPDKVIEKAWDDLSWHDSISSFEKGVRWALEYLNAQRGGKP